METNENLDPNAPENAALANLNPAGDVNTDTDTNTNRGKKIPVRVLLDCEHGKCNEVVDLTAAVAKRAEKDGLVDSNPKAVAYVLNERGDAGEE